MASITTGPGAGTAPAVTLNGANTDKSGHVHLKTGMGTIGNLAMVFKVTFATPYATKPIVLLVPEGVDSFQLYGNQAVSVRDPDVSVSGFTVKAGFHALQQGHLYYGWYYTVIPQ